MNDAIAPQYLLRPGDVDADRDTVLGIWAGNLGQDAKMAEKYRWFYQQSPHGPPLLQVLQHGDESAGACAAGVRTLLLDEVAVAAGVLVDLAVLPAHRSLGPAMMLQQALVDAADERLDLLYGFPNPKAAPVFRRMGYAHVADMTRYVRVLRHARYLQRHLPAWLSNMAGPALDLTQRLRRRLHLFRYAPRHVRLQDGADARIESLCALHPLRGALTCRRDLPHLQWRLDKMPGARTRHAVVENHGDGRLLAWFCWRQDERTATLLDFWSIAPENGVPAACIESLCLALWREGFVSVQVEMATAPARLGSWLASGFRARGVRPLFLRWRARPTQPPDLHITAADEDE